MSKRTDVNKSEVSIYTWGKKEAKESYHNPRWIIDVSDWRNPECNAAMRKYPDGRNPEVIKWMEEDPRVGVLSKQLRSISHMMLRSMKDTWITIGIIDHHGKWTAPAIAEIVANDLASHFTVGVEHRNLK